MLLSEAIRPEFRVDVYVAEPSDPVLFGALCAVSGCPARGVHHLMRDHYLCRAHGKQWRGDGRPDVQRWVRVGARPLQSQMLAARCQARECPRSVFCHGLCYPHFGRWKLAGRPDRAAWATGAAAAAVQPERRCRLPGCRFPAMGKRGFCDSHNMHFAHLRAADPAATPANLIERATRRLRSSAPRFDARGLPELVRLELQFALQCRHDARRARLAPVAFRNATKWLAELGVESLLKRSGRFFDQAARERFASARVPGRGCPELAWVRYARARLQDLRDEHSGIDAWQWDTWTVERIGVDARYAHQPHRRIYFADIEPAWLRELAVLAGRRVPRSRSRCLGADKGSRRRRSISNPNSRRRARRGLLRAVSIARFEGPAEAKGYRRGTHRLVPPVVTWRRIEPLLRDFGITRVADLTGFDDVGIPVFQAVRPDAHTLAVSHGKGLTRELARVSAAMESIEYWHAEHVGPAAVRGSELELGPLGYPLLELQLEPRSVISSQLVLDWLGGTCLLSGAPALAPRDYVRLSSVVRPGWALPGFVASTNGLASGNSIAEATLHGLCELVERDRLAAALEAPRYLRAPVELGTVDDPDCRELLDRFAAAANNVEVLDLAGDSDIPCYYASIASLRLPVTFSGLGCHPDSGVALARALTEAVQSRVTILTGARDDQSTAIYGIGRDQPRRPKRKISPESVAFAQARSLATDSVEEDLARVAERVRDRTGVEPIVVDLSHPAYGVPVVKVLAPGLRAPRERREFGGGR